MLGICEPSSVIEKYSCYTKAKDGIGSIGCCKGISRNHFFVTGIIFINWLAAFVSPKMNKVGSYRHVSNQLLLLEGYPAIKSLINKKNINIQLLRAVQEVGIITGVTQTFCYSTGTSEVWALSVQLSDLPSSSAYRSCLLLTLFPDVLLASFLLLFGLIWMTWTLGTQLYSRIKMLFSANKEQKVARQRYVVT